MRKQVSWTFSACPCCHDFLSLLTLFCLSLLRILLPLCVCTLSTWSRSKVIKLRAKMSRISLHCRLTWLFSLSLTHFTRFHQVLSALLMSFHLPSHPTEKWLLLHERKKIVDEGGRNWNREIANLLKQEEEEEKVEKVYLNFTKKFQSSTSSFDGGIGSGWRGVDVGSRAARCLLLKSENFFLLLEEQLKIYREIY